MNAYLPDDLGRRAKEADLPFSQLLRDAVTSELERREAVTATLADTKEYLIEVRHPEGYVYTGRINGKLIARARDAEDLYVTDDERLLLHDEEGRISEVTLDDVEQWDTSAYIEASVALGEKPIIDL